MALKPWENWNPSIKRGWKSFFFLSRYSWGSSWNPELSIEIISEKEGTTEQSDTDFEIGAKVPAAK